MNISDYLSEHARQRPHNAAVVHSLGGARMGDTAYSQVTFGRLDRLCNAYARRLTQRGIARGMRVLVMVRPGCDFVAVVFALFRMGAVPVLIDPGMGLRGFLRCVRGVSPDGFVGIPLAQGVRRLFPRSFQSVHSSLTLSPRLYREMTESVREGRGGPYCGPETELNDLAGILFTTGSTGPAKGVEYTVRTFRTQVDILGRQYAISPGETDLPCFPLFGLFSVALGATVVIPRMNPSRPADVDPREIIRPVLDHGVRCSFGSPALWRTVARYCVVRGIRLEPLQRVFMAGAPVPAPLHRTMLEHVLPPGAEIHTPYGATESLPVASISGAEVLQNTAADTEAGRGQCVGYPVDEADVRIIRIDDEPIQRWDDELQLPTGKVGEITVAGPMVTERYYARPDTTQLAKIRHGGQTRHRVGDLGHFDSEGRLWVCGRKSHRVTTPEGVLFTICCEAIFNRHPKVYRSALVGVGPQGRQVPAVVVEPEPGEFPRTPSQRARFRAELRELAASAETTGGIEWFLFRRCFPTDIRHNSKIRREVLRDWAASRLQGRATGRKTA